MVLDTSLLESVRTLAQAASDRILEIYQSSFKVKHKKDNSPVTEADLVAHEMIVEGLHKLTPEIPILSEESTASSQVDFQERKKWTYYWLVDPLDGTRSFIERRDDFTVNIALIKKHKPVMGVVGVPVKGDFYTSMEGAGAHCYDQEGGQGRSIHVRQPITRPWRVAASRSHKDPMTQSLIDQLGELEFFSIGSSLKICLLAEGQIDIYPRLAPTSEWDTAAAHCVLVEAGGHLVDLQLQPLLYNTKESLLNPSFLAFGDSNVDWGSYLSSIADRPVG